MPGNSAIPSAEQLDERCRRHHLLHWFICDEAFASAETIFEK